MLLAPTLLAPIWRYASDDWSGSNALTDTVTHADGTPMDLTGCTVQGVITYRATGTPLPAPTGALVDAAAGKISLSLLRDKTAIAGQAQSDWGTPDASLLLVRYRVLDASSVLVTHDIQPLFVF